MPILALSASALAISDLPGGSRTGHLVEDRITTLAYTIAAGTSQIQKNIPLDPLTPVGVVAARGAPREPRAPHGQRIGTAADATAWRLRGTVLTAALQVGVARGGLDLAVRYAKERVQFGRAIGGFQAVKHLLAESLARVELARAAAAKLLADDAATTGGRTCVQVHGGMGFTWEVLAHLYLKRAWVHETAFGPAEEHALFLADRLTGGVITRRDD